MAFGQFPDDEGREVVGADGRQAAAEVTDGGTDAVDDVGHGMVVIGYWLDW